MHIFSGDMVLEINGRRVRHADMVRPILNTRRGKLTLAVVAVERKGATREEKRRTPGSRVKRARDLFAKVRVIKALLFTPKMQHNFQNMTC